MSMTLEQLVADVAACSFIDDSVFDELCSRKRSRKPKFSRKQRTLLDALLALPEEERAAVLAMVEKLRK